ncbi:MAG: retron system putative HNH endonuclease [Emticicia sp.]|uniref:retron system putative HNH endonuclease n=1 Tax=Emticicia sp. TaxID=1930953 RepID=UPI003BA634DE
MIPFLRGANPLSPQEEKSLGEWWTAKYAETKKSSSWSWKGKEKVIKEALFLCNNDHCAYCDCHPLKDDKGFEIDHFVPKTIESQIAFTYSNLFPSCNECNKKSNNYDPLMLKPDELDYKFEDYFRFDSFTGEIIPNESKPLENQERAKITKDILRLNIGNKPINRLKAIKKEIKLNTPLDERPYRYGY